jgi:hypothetical protein
MVAYSFNTAFIADIEAGTKRQTIRLPRKRHARPGEMVQLFTAMRTKHCRKIIPDQICVGVDEVIFDLRGLPTLQVNGIPVIDDEADAYARGDGFHGFARRALGEVKPFDHMSYWWQRVHGRILFSGVAIRWQPPEEGQPA